MSDLELTLSPDQARLLDYILALIIAVPGTIVVATGPAGLRLADLPVVVLLLGCAWSVTARHRRPIGTTLCVAGAYVVVVQIGSLDPTASTPTANIAAAAVVLTFLVLALTLGGADPLFGSLAAAVVLACAAQWQQFNPLPFVVIGGAWVVGRILRARRILMRALNVRGAELAAERERYAMQAVRYERARIARELHDIVAHCISVAVIQAAAGRRLPDADRDGCDQILAAICGLAREAGADIGALTQLLREGDEAARPLSRAAVDDLITHAAATGTAIDVSVIGDLAIIPAPASTALHRVLQEALTNAVKHAPAAPISITVTCGSQSAQCEIRNEPPNSGGHLVDHGGRNGLVGLRERLDALGGTFCAGPTESGGWQLRASVPLAER